MRTLLPKAVFLPPLALIAIPAVAQEAPPPERTVTVTVYGDEQCPKGADDEIVVCARQPESERYRIPKKFRHKKDNDAVTASWGARVQTLEEAARPMRPGSCSVNGSFGQTGCTQEMLRRWFAEKRAAQSEAADIP